MTDRLALPLRLAPNGRLAVVEQDSDEDRQQCLVALLRTRPGDRADLPSMGVPDQTFTRIDPAAIQAQIATHEPRVSANTDVDLDDLIATVTVGWQPQEGG